MTTKAKAKTQYNAEQENIIVEAVEGVENYAEQREIVEDLAASMGKTVRSITAKLSGLAKLERCKFIKKTYAKETKENTKPAEKSVIVSFIAEIIGTDAESIETLEKANKTALLKVFMYLNNQVLELEKQETEVEIEVEG